MNYEIRYIESNITYPCDVIEDNGFTIKLSGEIGALNEPFVLMRMEDMAGVLHCPLRISEHTDDSITFVLVEEEEDEVEDTTFNLESRVSDLEIYLCELYESENAE